MFARVALRPAPSKAVLNGLTFAGFNLRSCKALYHPHIRLNLKPRQSPLNIVIKRHYSKRFLPRLEVKDAFVFSAVHLCSGAAIFTMIYIMTLQGLDLPLLLAWMDIDMGIANSKVNISFNIQPLRGPLFF
eukprot:TRINITY_DN3510_c0_g1_i2.p1 TRINITY_DN3510_c0_g1~~TRINITY_DN3510_c0_g1_i2.p1  ORF type:complete len:131 (-),score=1.15 TRINITY_DN3510_c0_g1_i2:99-491(-)